MTSARDVFDDLFTPLAVMKGAISIVLKHGDQLSEEERERWLKLAIEQSDELNKLIVKLDLTRSDQIKID